MIQMKKIGVYAITLILISCFQTSCVFRKNPMLSGTEKKQEEIINQGQETYQYKIREGRKEVEKVHELDFRFDDVQLKDVVSLVMGVLRLNYIVIGNLVGVVDIEIVGKYPETQIIMMLKSILNAQGYDLTRSDDNYYIDRVTEDNPIEKINLENGREDFYIYKLQYQNASNVAAILKDIYTENEIRQNELLNMVIVRASDEDYRKIQHAIETLDKRPRQIIVDMSIIEVTLTDSLRYGVEYFFRAAKGKDTYNTNISLLPANVKSGAGVLESGIKAFALTHDMDSFINILEQKTKVDVISKPKIIVQDGKASVIKIGRSEPVIRGTTLTSTGLSQQNIDYRDVGLTLNVKADIEENNIIKLNIVQELSDIVTVTTDPLIKSPSFTQKHTEVELLVRGGDKIYIGGLMQNETNESINKVPIIGNIPILGKLFSSTDRKKEKTELILYVDVTLLSDDRDIFINTKKRIKEI